ncbi:hypothetical protein ACFYPG_14785 [Micromonospora sp. NPDC005553]|uniref:hypothetical protein n=1 Tax=Micromonospora sp. NPDC005553 TaxID=3364232 RepID=UPI00367E668C
MRGRAGSEPSLAHPHRESNAVASGAGPPGLSGLGKIPSGEVEMNSEDGTTVLWRPTGPELLSRHPVRQAGGKTILELWMPAEELDEFNAHIVGLIEVAREFR